MLRLVLAALLAVVAAGACARAYPPPGGERDVTPPRLVSTSPERLAIVPGYEGDVVFRFDERLSERGFSEALVIVSPLDGALRVDRGRTEVRVRIDGGWRPERVYRITLLPGIRDRFGNARSDPVELVFSTGPPVPETAVAGIILDRISGRAAANGTITAVRRADSVMYMAIADSGGFFALRHLPLGAYDLRAWSDQNRNRRRDLQEPVDSGRFVSLGSPADTQTVILTVIAPDTTPPRVTAAQAVDSLHVRLTFDDYLMPEAPLDNVSGAVFILPDSTQYAGLVRAEHPTAFEQRQRAERAAADSARAASDTAVAAPPVRQTPAPAQQQDPLPSRDLVLTLQRPLQPGTTYRVIVSGVTNLQALVGGGSARFETRAAPPARPDTAAVSRRPR